MNLTVQRAINIAALVLFSALFYVMLTGCAMVSGARTAPDGSRIVVRSLRFLWASEAIDFSVTTPEGITASLRVAKSRSDPESIKEAAMIAEAIARGMAKGIVP
jgi:hypothetical protein